MAINFDLRDEKGIVQMGALSVSSELEGLLGRETTFDTIAFSAVRELLERHIRIGDDGSLIVYPIKDIDLRLYDQRQLKENTMSYVGGGLPVHHIAGCYFDNFILGKETEHRYTTTEEYSHGVQDHLRRIFANAKRHNVLSNDDISAITRAIDDERLRERRVFQDSWNLIDRVDITLRHGKLTMGGKQGEKVPRVLFVKSRIKGGVRAIGKYARYVCSGILRYNELIKYCNSGSRRNENRVKSSLRAIDTLADCNLLRINRLSDSEVKLPQLIEHINPMDYLFAEGRVRDVYGTTYVVETVDEARDLVNRIVRDNFRFNRFHQVVGGVRASFNPPNDSINFKTVYLVDDNEQRGDKLNPRGNNRIDFYMKPIFAGMKLYCAEVAVTTLRGFATDELCGTGSHYRYAATQRAMVKSWSRGRNRNLYLLHEAIVESLNPIAAGLDALTMIADKVFREGTCAIQPTVNSS